MKKIKLYITVLYFFLTSAIFAQIKIGNNPTTINAGSVLEVESTNKGLLFPRVSLSSTTTWGLAGTAAAGMSVYNTNAAIAGTAPYPTTGAGLYYFDGTGWVSKNAKGIATATEPWYNVATGTGATSNTQNIYQMGSVGVGTTNPLAKLDVSGGDINFKTVNSEKLYFNDGLTTGNIRMFINTAAMEFQSNKPAGVLFKFGQSGYDYLNIMANGNVGINNATPSAKLHVVGDATGNAVNITPAANQYGMSMTTVATAGQSFGATIAAGTNSSDASFYVRNATGAIPYLMVRGDGNVGIGTAGPGGKLDVVSSTPGTNTLIVRSSGVNSNGVYAEATGGGGSAGYFNATGTSNAIAAYATNGLGVYGQSTSNTGVYGVSTAANGVYGVSTSNHGVFGKTMAASGVGGVLGMAANGTTYGMLGVNNQYALYGNGDIFITGSIAKSGGTFKIDHPQDPANKYLIHSFVESPDMMNVYNGNIVTDANGNATVQLPDYFLSLNKEFRYQLTAMGTFAQAIIAEEVNAANQFKIKTDKPNVKISWQVTGIRKDAYANAHRVKDVVEKVGEEKGKYIHPELYNQPAQNGVFYKDIKASADIKKITKWY
jgi:hypothetical protein